MVTVTLKSGKEVVYRPLNRLEVADVNDEIVAYWAKYPDSREMGIVPLKAMIKILLVATKYKVEDLNGDWTSEDFYEAGNAIIEGSTLSEADKKK